MKRGSIGGSICLLFTLFVFISASSHQGSIALKSDSTTFAIDYAQASDALRSRPPAFESEPWIFTGGPVGGLGYDVRMVPEKGLSGSFSRDSFL